MIPSSWLEEAAERISPYIRKTPLTYDPNNDLYLKWENQQETGSFKPRGAINKVLSLQGWERAKGLVAASAGNHGQGVALAGKLVGTPVLVFASEHVVPSKVQAMRSLGAEVRLVSGGYAEAERAAIQYAASHGSPYISPYNDGQVIAGQGTLGLEILHELPALPEATWVVPVGGGGLISGIGLALESETPARMNRTYRLIGVQSEASPFMHALFSQNSQEAVVELSSLADGLAGSVEEGSLTIPMVRRYADGIVLVSEAEIEKAIAYAWQRYDERLEGSAAVALAAVLYGHIEQRPAVVVLSGGNIQPEIHAQIVSKYKKSISKLLNE